MYEFVLEENKGAKLNVADALITTISVIVRNKCLSQSAETTLS